MSAITFQKATKANLKARLAIDGPTGSGKTFTSLEVGCYLAAKATLDAGMEAMPAKRRVVFIDSERGSGTTYSDEFDYDYYRFEPPYEPARLIEVLKAAEEQGYGVVIIDSLSHFWEGEGGTLDIADAAAERARGNSFAGWKVATPALRHLVDTILGLDCHVITTMRSKMEYVLETNDKGKQVPRKVGLAPVMRQGIDYEFTVVVDMDLEHRMVVSKSRCKVLADQVIQPNRAKDMAATFLKWLEAGEPVAARSDVDDILVTFGTIEDPQQRKVAKATFVDAFGMPEHLLASQVAEARVFVRELAGIRPDPTPNGTGADAPTPPSTDAVAAHDASPAEDAAARADLLLDLEAAIKGLPTARQAHARKALAEQFGEPSTLSANELGELLKWLKAQPVVTEPRSADEVMEQTERATGTPPLNAKQRELVSYARKRNVDARQLVALASLLHETTEPRPLHELNEMGVLEVQRMVDRVVEGEIAFETPNGVLIAKEVVTA